MPDTSPVPQSNVRIAFDRSPRTSHEEKLFEKLRQLLRNNHFITRLNPLINDVHGICENEYQVVLKESAGILRHISIHELRTIEQSSRVAIIRCHYNHTV